MTCSWLGYIDNAYFAEHLLVLVHAGWLDRISTVACLTSGGIDSGLDADIVTLCPDTHASTTRGRLVLEVCPLDKLVVIVWSRRDVSTGCRWQPGRHRAASENMPLQPANFGGAVRDNTRLHHKGINQNHHV
jgi:hypothetical protein